MNTTNQNPQSTSELPALTLERIIDAPRDLVWRAWTEAEQLAVWWGPRHFTNPVCELDLRPGGAILIHMAGPDGVVYPMKGIFNEIVPPERLVMTTTAIENEAGEVQLEDITTVTFEDLGGKTKLTVHALVTKATPAAAGALSGMEQGWTESLDRLAEFVATA